MRMLYQNPPCDLFGCQQIVCRQVTILHIKLQVIAAITNEFPRCGESSNQKQRTFPFSGKCVPYYSNFYFEGETAHHKINIFKYTYG